MGNHFSKSTVKSWTIYHEYLGKSAMYNIIWPKMFFKVFSETAHELMVMRKPPNAHPRPLLMQREPTDLFNLLRPKSHFPVETLMLCCNIVTVKQMI